MTETDTPHPYTNGSAFATNPFTRNLFRAFYRIAQLGFRLTYKVVWRLRVHGVENIPSSGGIIFASNHASLADPPLVGSVVPRMIHFMAKQELFDIPIFGHVIHWVNAFPVRRVERDIGAFKTAQRILAGGGGLILFPEGHRQRNGTLGRAKSGVGMLANKTGSNIVPVYIHNSHRFWSFNRLSVSFGKPLPPGKDKDYQSLSGQVMDSISALKASHHGS